MNGKKCFKCGECKPLSDFYKHKQMADGHLNKCRDCTRQDAKSHRLENIEQVRAYDRKRGARQRDTYLKEYREKYPNKYRAHNLVNNNVRSGNLVSQPCEICGETSTVAHHDDYLMPLNVRWLCQAHHKQWHAKNGEAKNA